MRHNILRNTEVKLMEKMFHDVRIEPALIPTVDETIRATAADGARCDVSAKGIWNNYDKTFFDIAVTHPNAQAHMHKPIDKLYKEFETRKKTKYNDRIVNTERASFTPLVFTTTGGMGGECEKLNKRLAELISIKTNQSYSHVISDIRRQLRFALLKSTVIAIRGFRKGQANDDEVEVEMDVPFNLIPQENAYEA